MAKLEEALKNNRVVEVKVEGRCMVREQYEYLQQPPDFSIPRALSINRYIHLAERRLFRKLPFLWPNGQQKFKLLQRLVHLRSIKREVCALEVKGCCLLAFFQKCVLDEVTYDKVWCSSGDCFYKRHIDRQREWQYSVVFKSLDNAIYHSWCDLDFESRGYANGLVQDIVAANYPADKVFRFDRMFLWHDQELWQKIRLTQHVQDHA